MSKPIRLLHTALTSAAVRRPALILGVDILWSWMSGVVGTPLLVALLALPLPRATAYIDAELEPVLMFNYLATLLIQLSWIGWIARHSSLRQAQQRWWLLVVAVLLSSVAMQSQIARLGRVEVPAATHVVLVAIELITLLVTFWLPSALLTPLPQRQQVPLSAVLNRAQA